VMASNPQADLAALAAKNGGVINLDQKTFDLITSPKRNWTAAVHFTAMDPRRRCKPCNEFSPAWTTVAKSWTKVSSSQRDTFFFGTLDFDSASSVFQKLGMQSAPSVYVYPAATGPHKSTSNPNAFIKYDFSAGFDAEPLAEQLSRHTVVPIPYSAPIDWSRWVTVVGLLIPFLASLRYALPVLTNRWTWAVLTVGTSLIMTSGFMFVKIRGQPFTGGNGWIASGYQNQYGQETQVISLIYGVLASAFVVLTLVTPSIASPARQRTQIYLWNIIIVVVFSILLSLFRVKNRSYPFKLFL